MMVERGRGKPQSSGGVSVILRRRGFYYSIAGEGRLQCSWADEKLRRAMDNEG